MRCAAPSGSAIGVMHVPETYTSTLYPQMTMVYLPVCRYPRIKIDHEQREPPLLTVSKQGDAARNVDVAVEDSTNVTEM
jgi:hypothetical protein